LNNGLSSGRGKKSRVEICDLLRRIDRGVGLQGVVTDRSIDYSFIPMQTLLKRVRR